MNVARRLSSSTSIAVRSSQSEQLGCVMFLSRKHGVHHNHPGAKSPVQQSMIAVDDIARLAGVDIRREAGNWRVLITVSIVYCRYMRAQNELCFSLDFLFPSPLYHLKTAIRLVDVNRFIKHSF